MSVGNDYSFEPYLNWRDRVDYYRDDALLQRLLKHYSGAQFAGAAKRAGEISSHVSRRWNQAAIEAAHPLNHPTLVHFDAHDRRIDRIRRAAATLEMEREIFALGLYADTTTRWQRLIQLFLIYQNGEASICCPLTCTEGMVAMLDRFADTPELERIRKHVKTGIDGEFAIGAQYLSEIQGGSDVNANRVEACERDGEWHIYGKKFFCSAAHADYALVSAKPEGSERIAAFIVPAWLAGEKSREQRNGQRIERLKLKMGTCELPTAEIEFDGARAYPLGPLDKGLANIVGIVLTASRTTVGIFSAAVMTRAAREARAYAEFRQAFGKPIGEYPLLARQLEQIEMAAQRTTAGVFQISRLQEQRDEPAIAGKEEARRLDFDLRLLVMLQKITAAEDSVECLHRAISVFGGHGAIEDFSTLPRLLRDAMVNELWEGPRNVLLTQIHRDLQKAKAWYASDQLIARILPDAPSALREDLANEARDLLAGKTLDAAEVGADDRGFRWALFCTRIMHEFQIAALNKVA